MAEVTLQKLIYNDSEFRDVIDTNFSELTITGPSSITNVLPDMSVDQFFGLYESLYYEIPVSGSENSHLGLASKSLQSMGVSLEDLQIEIDFLRQENIELKNQVLQISGLNSGDIEEI